VGHGVAASASSLSLRGCTCGRHLLEGLSQQSIVQT
jgi:hypothetical protein